MSGVQAALAIAHSNIALAKYWGKADIAANLPAVPSLSLTLDNLRTATKVRFDPQLSADDVWLDGARASGRPLDRVVELLERVRRMASTTTFARVESVNDFPTAAGLASSASGFAALALAATTAIGLQLSPEDVSAIARASSASAARSLFGGYAILGARSERAERLATGNDLPVAMLVAVTAAGPKSVGSTEGMKHTAKTSPYYPAWLDHAPAVFENVKRAVLARDFEAMGRAAEHSALMMHASMMAADPAIIYFVPVSLAVIARVRELRSEGTPAYVTMDAGPHVKVLTLPEAAPRVQAALLEVPGVQRVIGCQPGPDAHLVNPDLSLQAALSDHRNRKTMPQVPGARS